MNIRSSIKKIVNKGVSYATILAMLASSSADVFAGSNEMLKGARALPQTRQVNSIYGPSTTQFDTDSLKITPGLVIDSTGYHKDIADRVIADGLTYLSYDSVTNVSIIRNAFMSYAMVNTPNATQDSINVYAFAKDGTPPQKLADIIDSTGTIDSTIIDSSYLASALLLLPANGDSLPSNKNILFRWTSSSVNDSLNKDSLEYIVNIFKNDGAFGFTRTTPDTETTIRLDSGAYQWNVTSKLGSYIAESDTGNFYVFLPNVNPIDTNGKKNNLLKIFPNPSKGPVTIEYNLKEQSNVNLYVINTMGQLVRKYHISNAQKGTNTLIHDGKNSLGNETASGPYFYMLEATSTKDKYVGKSIKVK